MSIPVSYGWGFSFGQALFFARSGHRVTRQGWNGKDMFVYLETHMVCRLAAIPFEPVLVMRTVDGKYQPGWVPSQADMLSDDWFVVERPLPPAPKKIEKNKRRRRR